MGWGDFISEVGDWAEGVGHGAQAVVHAGQEIGKDIGAIGKGVGWVANPYHYDDIAHGVGAAGSFVANHPGQTWDIGFGIGKQLLKDELLDPKHLAINLGLTAATVLTGGGAGAALATRLGEGALGVIRGTRIGSSLLREAKGIEEGVATARAISTGVRTAEEVGGVARGAEEAGGFSRALSRVDNILSPNARTEGLKAQWKPGTIVRNQIANRIEAGAGEGGASIARQMASDWVRQSATKPVFREGTSELAQTISTNAWRARRANTLRGRAETVGNAGGVGESLYQAETHPVKFALGLAEQHGYDPRGAAQKAMQGVAKEATKKVLNTGSERKHPVLDATASQPMAPLRQPTYDAGMVASPGYPRSSTANAQASGYETVRSEVGPITVGSRRSSFYNGVDTAYQRQSIYDTAGV